jgi:hypothetical protein
MNHLRQSIEGRVIAKLLEKDENVIISYISLKLMHKVYSLERLNYM